MEEPDKLMGEKPIRVLNVCEKRAVREVSWAENAQHEGLDEAKQSSAQKGLWICEPGGVSWGR